MIEDRHAERREVVSVAWSVSTYEADSRTYAPTSARERKCAVAEGVVFRDREQLMLCPEVVMPELRRHRLGGVQQLV